MSFRSLGSTAYLRNHRQTPKLNPHYRKGLLLSNEEETDTYRMWGGNKVFPQEMLSVLISTATTTFEIVGTPPELKSTFRNRSEFRVGRTMLKARGGEQ
jgi:hypothetical protein